MNILNKSIVHRSSRQELCLVLYQRFQSGRITVPKSFPLENYKRQLGRGKYS